jgi:hypothetical protein
MADNNVTITERTGQLRFGRTKNRDNWNTDKRSQMHRAGIVRQNRAARAQFSDQFVQCRLTNPVYAFVAKLRGNCFANGRVVFRAE